MKYILLLFLLPIRLRAQFSAGQIRTWQQQAQRVTIIRDNWGVPHIYGKKDADCAFESCIPSAKTISVNWKKPSLTRWGVRPKCMEKAACRAM
ncbi:penicillin acylase family protein [Paraflavitalea speifideaquila]|uniref:penicillin acylase family protein n=1 Tax=Paraflavitalea speifideaquila TaxID=3076558 RepID=UPI0028E944C3|nr:penicillin acylase family protein [Paraflavitalea speifideiaquila]